MNLGDKYTSNPINLAKIFNISEERAVEIWEENKEKLLTGKEKPKEFLVSVNKKLKSSIDIDRSCKIWKELDKIEKDQINWKLVDYIKFLRRKYKIYMLTDTFDLGDGSSELFNLVVKHFDGIYKSFEIGYKKTNKQAFLYMLKEINLKPEECIFIDDFQENVNVANQTGIKGILYTNFYRLKKDLQFLV